MIGNVPHDVLENPQAASNRNSCSPVFSPNQSLFRRILEPSIHESIARLSDLVDPQHSWATAWALIKTGAYKVDLKLPRIKWFKWKSGIEAPCYCDCRALNAHAKERNEISRCLTESVRQAFPDTQAIAALADAGISWARTVADELQVPFFYVKTHPKSYGSGGLVQCDPPPNLKTVIVDDLVASADSATNAINALIQEKNIRVLGVQSIVNWNFHSMRQNLLGYKVRALTSYPYILGAALMDGLITDLDYLELDAFYQKPQTYTWRCG